MKKEFQLPCYDIRKSFYGKAIVKENNGEKTLFSYNTPVARINANGHFIRLWSGYSATTMRHVNSFLTHYDIPGGGKTWWSKQPIGK